MKYFLYCVDFLYFIAIFTIFDRIIGDHFTPVKAAGTFLVTWFAVLRDICIIKCLPWLVPKAVSIEAPRDLLLQFGKIHVTFMSAMGLMQYTGVAYWEISWIAYIEFVFMLLIKEVQLNIFHAWMHKRPPKSAIDKEFKRMHSMHHRTNTNLWVLNAFYTEILDGIFENLLAPVVLIASKYMLGRMPHINLAAFSMLVLFDLNCHSAYPHTLCFYNPLDFYMKPTIAHHIHHTNPNKNINQIPFHHFYRLDKDIALYNKMHFK
mgnify:FL=1